MNATVNKVIHGIILTFFLVGGLGPTVAGFAGIVPSNVYAVVSHIIAVCAGLSLYAMSSPFLQPYLPTRTSAAVVAAGMARMESEKLPSPSKPPSLRGVPPMVVLAFVGVLGAFGCAAFGPGVADASTAIGPALACIVQAVDAVQQPSTTTIESTVAACGVAAVDVAQVVSSIEALAAAPPSASLLKPGVAVKIRAMKHTPLPSADLRDIESTPAAAVGWL